MEKKLKSGYTTGVHTLFAFRSCLDTYLATSSFCQTKSIKVDNDDLDVTKGCEIIVTISCDLKDLRLNSHSHNPKEYIANNNCLKIYAGEGVGIVTKRGLKIEPSFPAINPTPLNAILEYFKIKTQEQKDLNLFCTIGVKDGVEIAKKTANEKVGVINGISILGTTGIVKPISSWAYIESIKTEIKFAQQNNYSPVYFTLGNSAFEVAKKKTNKEAIVEVGNFIYDSIKIASGSEKNANQEIIFLLPLGKMTKVYQGFKNTHNRFGMIDFIKLQKDIKDELCFDVDIESTKTVKGIAQELEANGLLEDFYEMIRKKADEQIKKWAKNIDAKAIILDAKEQRTW